MDKQNKFVMMGPGFSIASAPAVVIPFVCIVIVVLLAGFGLGLLF